MWFYILNKIGICKQISNMGIGDYKNIPLEEYNPDYIGMQWDEDNKQFIYPITIHTLEEYKEKKQEENKEIFQQFLKSNPILWIDGNHYGVTQEDQIEMQTDLTAYKLKQEMGVSDWKLEWHNIHNSCREFTVEEFLGLTNDIIDFVVPLRRKLEVYKEQIYNSQSKSELDSIEIEYRIEGVGANENI